MNTRRHYCDWCGYKKREKRCKHCKKAGKRLEQSIDCWNYNLD